MAKTLNPDYLVIVKQVPDPKNPSAASATVVAPLPETLAYDTASEYSTPFAQGMMGEGNLSQALSAFGVRMATQAMTAQLWQGSTDSDISLDLDFQTYSDPDADVRQPVLTLLKLAAASASDDGLLQSPGPRISLEDISKVGAQAGAQAKSGLKQTIKAGADVVGSVNVSKYLSGPAANLNANQQGNAPPPPANGLGGSQFWKNTVRNQISIQIGNYAFWDSVVILSAQETWSNQIDARTGLPLHCKVSLRFKPLFLVTQQDLDKIFALRAR